jgi:protease IV
MRELLAHVAFRGLIRERSVDPYLRILRGLRERGRVKGVLLDISSGGGESIASTDFYLAVKRLNAVKPVVASIGSTGASGAYMAALGARRLFAYPDSVVGSIGVVFPHFATRDLLRRIGISVDLVHVGEHKDAYQAYRPLTGEERTKLQAVAQQTYDGFVALVAQERHRPLEEVRSLATGEFWTGAKALQLGLVDALGDRDAALDELSRLTGVPTSKTVRVAPPRAFFERLFAGGASVVARAFAGQVRDSVEEGLLDVGGPGFWR